MGMFYMEVSSHNEEALSKWTGGAFYGVGSCWFLKTEEGEIKLYAGDIVAKVGETVKDGVPQPVFAAYEMRRLKPE